MSLFSQSVRHATLLRQSFVGADGVRVATCAGCDKHIARMTASGGWVKLIPFDFDHRDEQAHGGGHTLDNCQALCSGPDTCHAAKTAEFVALNAKADAQAGRTGQYARRMARKARGERPLIPQHKNAWGKR
ncbi:MAG: HNH endonuclease [Hyphomonadaceae bacterium]|nr:HNH endonuclease [Hyphomonadaceae bacterium]